MKPVTILVADDDPDVRKLIREAFEECKSVNDLRFVNDGEELLDYLNRRGKFANRLIPPRPGIVLLDLNMPRNDGRVALLEIKAESRFRSLRVIVFTTSKAPEDVIRAFNLSAACYITKPAAFETCLRLSNRSANIGWKPLFCRLTKKVRESSKNAIRSESLPCQARRKTDGR